MPLYVGLYIGQHMHRRTIAEATVPHVQTTWNVRQLHGTQRFLQRSRCKSSRQKNSFHVLDSQNNGVNAKALRME